MPVESSILCWETLSLGNRWTGEVREYDTIGSWQPALWRTQQFFRPTDVRGKLTDTAKPASAGCGWVWSNTTKSFLTIYIHPENKEMHYSPHMDLHWGRLAPCCSRAHQHILAPWSDGSLGSVSIHNASLANLWPVYRFQGYWQDPSQAIS